MGAKKYTAEEIIEVARNIAMIPDTGALGSEDADLLQWINEGITLYLLPKLIRSREDYFVQRERTALGTASQYRIPHRAAYGKLKNLWHSSGTTRSRLTHQPERFRGDFSDTASGTPAGYFLEGDYVVLLPEGGGTFSGYLEFVYYMRPGELVKATSAGVISSVTGKVITCTADVSSLFSIGDVIDVHSAYSGAEMKEWDLTVSNVATTDVTVNETIDGTVFGRHGVSAGDYVCLAEQCALPTLPREMHPMVARAAALAFCESIGDDEGVQRHAALLGNQINEAAVCIESRVEQKPLKLGAYGWV